MEDRCAVAHALHALVLGDALNAVFMKTRPQTAGRSHRGDGRSSELGSRRQPDATSFTKPRKVRRGGLLDDKLDW